MPASGICERNEKSCDTKPAHRGQQLFLRSNRLLCRVEADAGGCGEGEQPKKGINMKTAAMTLALTLSLSALNTLAKEDNDRPRRSTDTPRGGELMKQGEGRRLQRPLRNDADRERPEDIRPMQRPWRGQAGPWQRFAPRGPGFGAGGRGQEFVPPSAGRGGPQQSDGVCPRCGRPGGPLGPQGRPGEDPGLGRGGRGPGFGPPAFAPGRGLQGRGPAFGPPPWAGRGPGGPEGRFERRGPGPRFEGRGPANRPPMEDDDR